MSLWNGLGIRQPLFLIHLLGWLSYLCRLEPHRFFLVWGWFNWGWLESQDNSTIGNLQTMSQMLPTLLVHVNEGIFRHTWIVLIDDFTESNHRKNTLQVSDYESMMQASQNPIIKSLPTLIKFFTVFLKKFRNFSPKTIGFGHRKVFRKEFVY